MAPHPDHPDWLEVRFHPKAIEEFSDAFPEMPPGDEIVLWIQLQPCSNCGSDHHGEFGAIDPEYITDEGLLVGRQLCHDCVKDEGAEEELSLHEERVVEIQELTEE